MQMRERERENRNGARERKRRERWCGCWCCCWDQAATQNSTTRRICVCEGIIGGRESPCPPFFFSLIKKQYLKVFEFFLFLLFVFWFVSFSLSNVECCVVFLFFFLSLCCVVSDSKVLAAMGLPWGRILQLFAAFTRVMPLLFAVSSLLSFLSVFFLQK